MRVVEGLCSKIGFVILESGFSKIDWYNPLGVLLLNGLVSVTL
jgi:hypothetical protein